MKLTIHRHTAAKLPMRKLRSLFDLIVKKEGKPTWRGVVNLVFTTDRKIQDLNNSYRGKDKPTDVLSFNIELPESDDSTFGEIYISTPTARRQAAAYGGDLSGEYLRLFCHGLLHLCGYDHKNPKDEKKMKSREMHFLSQVMTEVPR